VVIKNPPLADFDAGYKILDVIGLAGRLLPDISLEKLYKL